MTEKQSVLFLCTGNSARSQMAEAFLRKYRGDTLEVFSAGLEPKPINPLTVKVMDEVGIEIRGQTSKDLRTYLGKQSFRHVFIVCAQAKENCPTMYPFTPNVLHWPFEDPSAVVGTDDQKISKFREIRDQIEARIKDWIKDTELAYAS